MLMHKQQHIKQITNMHGHEQLPVKRAQISTALSPLDK